MASAGRASPRLGRAIGGPARRSAAAAVLGLGLLEVGALGAFGWAGGLELPLPRLLLPAAALAFYAAALRIAAHARVPGRVAWFVAALGRLILLPLAPELSDDVYRYLWDGHVFVQGVNPYAHAPADEALEALRTPWHDRINHPDVRTIYPPLAQLLFGLVALTGATATAAKAVWLAFDAGTAMLLTRIARSTGRRATPVLIAYLWSPLLVVETAWSAHFDVTGLFLLAALIRVADGPRSTGRAMAAGALLGLATALKWAPAAALPAAMRRQGARAALAFVAVVATLHLPFAAIGAERLAEGLLVYARHWSANAGAFALIARLVPDPVHARAVAAAAVLAVVVAATRRGWSMERALLWIVGAGLLLSPTVHPWYVLWALPMAALRGNAAFLALSGLAFLGYWGLGAYQATGTWPEPLWARAALWAPVWLALAVDFARAARRRGAGPPPEPQRQVSGREERHEGQ